MAPGGSGGGNDYKDAKELLDKIGQSVHAEVQRDAKTYFSELKGTLSLATIFDTETVSSPDPCSSDYTTHFDARGDPCKKDGTGKEEVNRFSVKEQAEYDNKKIKCSNGRDFGACAPYRRLSLCNKNMVKMDTNNDSKAKHDLLLDVCYAAKYEGESIKAHYPKYDAEYSSGSGSDFPMCTMLARSFADIGDIVRGKDLYRRDNKKKNQAREKEKLENKLKEYFEKIYKDVTSTRGKTNGEAAKARYKDTDNYYELREDWWEANRETVWKAITCSNELKDNRYFRQTCGDNENTTIRTPSHCRCDGAKGASIVPTYFDYVPQYLRWFEEWAEDFCRKKKKYVNIVKKFCREGENGKDKYCSRNGFDCEKTKRAIGKLRYGNQCTKCFFACYPYVDWIDNQRKQFLKQKEQFLKQKERYDNVINGTSSSSRQKRGARGSNDNGYEKIFYEKLKGNYGTVDAFLGLLNNEKACTAVNDTEGGTIHFEKVNSSSTNDTSGTNDASQGTFYRSEYCQPCPICGVKKENGKWEKKKDDKCNIKLYRPINDKNGTPITILKSGEGHDDIEEKLNEFCAKSENGSLYEEWKCYEIKHLKKVGEGEDDDLEYDQQVKDAGGLCILENKNKKNERGNNSSNEPEQFQKTFHNFFYYWVAHMLKDSIHWRTKKLDKCLKKGTKIKCTEKCITPCDCFKKWIEQKENEWTAIKEHFGKQDFGSRVGILGGVMTADFVLKYVLNIDELFNNIKDTYGDVKEIDHIKKLLEEDEKEQEASGVTDNKNNTTIDKLLNHEEEIANKCKDCPKPPKEPTTGPGAARSLTPAATGPSSPDQEHDNVDNGSEDDDDEEEEEDEDHGPDVDEPAEGEKAEVAEVETQEDATEKEAESGPTAPKVEGKAACTIVAELFQNPQQFKEVACNQKYAKNNSRLGWKCVTPTGSGSTATSGSDATTTPPSNSGSICVPPRRRRLYVTPLTKLAGGGNDTAVGGKAQTQPPVAVSQSSSTDNGVSTSTTESSLLHAFVKSAAVETFFLWHRYKEEKKPQAPIQLQVPNGAGGSEETPETSLKSGTIPTDFLRQMFYTLGDYRDLCVGAKEDVIKALKSGGIDISTINEKIKKTLNSDNKETGDTPGQEPSDEQREKWWDTNAQHIWNAMVCALTYKEDTSGEKGADSKPPKEDESLKKALLDTDGKQPKKIYQYSEVKLSDNDGDGTSTPKIVGSTKMESPHSPQANGTRLAEFVTRPAYFRYLEEWGETFCKERKKRLEKIKEECRGKEDGGKVCSGFGEDCQTNLKNDPSTIPDLECPGCARHCRWYKRWIEKKKIEFEEQKEAYSKQKEKCKEGSDNGFCGTVTTNKTAATFLQKLGPCSKNNENGKDKLDFSQPDNTFKEAENCKPCLKFKKNCQNGSDCSGAEGEKCADKNNIDAKDIGNEDNLTHSVYVRVSDNDTTKFDGDLKSFCEGAGIFKSIRKDEWKCGKVCGYVVCKPKNVNGETVSVEKGNDKHIITIRALVAHWVHNFLEDYNKIRKKLNPCINDGKEPKCIKTCDKKCNCAGKWIKLKQDEWGKIKNRLLDQYKYADQPDYPVTSFLQELIPQSAATIDKGNYDSLEKLVKKFKCKCADSSKTKDGDKRDLVLCFLEKLGEKAKNCPGKRSVEKTEKECQEYPPLPDEEYENEDENDKKVGKQAPGFCEIKDTTEQEEEEETCTPASSSPAPPPPPPPPPAPAPTPEPPAAPPPYLPPPLVTSTLAWSVGIGFAAFTYFFLKKKTKSSVGNLFQILQIPKGDYDIPTLKSSNRYIPYASDRYKGKTYIYIEGDSSGDEKYAFMSDTTDVTSSESEYEEIDINDIYVPGSPKYKTLIEVVLEPSKRDIQSNDISMNKFTDDEWNQLKKDFISNMLQNTQNTEPNILHDNVDNNTHPTMSRLNVDQKPFIMSIHDRNLYIGEEYSYDMSTNSGENNLYSGQNNVYSGIDPTSDNRDPYSDKKDPISDNHHPYSGIDLINAALNGDYDIYDEILKRKENELFGTNHTKQNTSTNNVAKNTNSDPILNQINLFHKWLDRHRHMCDQWDKNKKEELLDKLKKEWNKENNNNNAKTYNSDNKSSHNHVLNTDVSIQIDMDNPKPKNEFTNMDTIPDKSTMDTILDDLEKYNEPYYYDFYKDDIYYDVNDDKASEDHINMDHNKMDNNNSDVPTKVQIEMNVINNQELLQNEYPISHM
ncbi:hypothetical protein PFAG_05946 [Plasmodium falciparum Santa Lucia]|uniref:Erythrocyte membrane protein 1 n=1 Tax=Plasmodium falciparum Santa Lucia TaxID=478859 RepID=W7FNR4_PLAFA|nr:hypothetical protein PFAG_05946 [Plasmodium falciparum Santa Lucia]